MVVGAIAGAVLVAALVGCSPRSGAGRASRSSAAAFLAAWQAQLSSSWSVDEVEQRTTVAGATIAFRIHEAQRPPDSVDLAGGTISARRGQILIACATPPGATTFVCREAPTSQTWAESVAAQIASLRGLLTGPRPVYEVTNLGHACYRLTVSPAVTVLPVSFGRGARYCFDPTTHAVRMSTIERVGATDTTTVLALHAPATDADLALPATASYDR